ncbi:MAG: AhpC/TSA family protein [Bacteriovoracaceae bacterium]|nr:AhpC/TSA family protein [Bacteriovoracaceae bacterium]
MNALTLTTLLFFSVSTFASRTAEERKTIFQNATERLKESGIENKIPKTGDTFPDLKLGEKKVSEWISSGPLVVTFYRGGWCPYCVKQLKEINQSISSLKSLKANLIAISPEKENEVRKTKNKNNLDFLLLSDNKNQLARRLHLVFKVNNDVVTEYKALGIDLEESQGNKAYELPIPATFVISKNRKIIYAFADADYTKRAVVNDIIDAIKKDHH